MRAHRLYGMSPVEQIALTVNIALRRDAATLDYYRTGSSPDAFATLPKEWTADQIRSFQDYFDALMSGNLARRRMTKFMPADFKLIEARQPPLKDMYDEWLARIICYAFSVPASPFVSQVNRATSETLRLQATQEGLVPLKAWIKNALDHVIQVCMNEPGLEFVWVGDDAIDPLQQAQTLQILVSAGIKTREEARAELGLGAGGGQGRGAGGAGEVQSASRRVRPVHDGGAGLGATSVVGNLERELLVGGMNRVGSPGDPLDRSCFRLYSTDGSLKTQSRGNMELIPAKTSLVVAGAWNAAILTPAWVLQHAFHKSPQEPPRCRCFCRLRLVSSSSFRATPLRRHIQRSP